MKTIITLENIIELAKEEFKENTETYDGNDSDLIAELADSAAFMYDNEYLDLASRYSFLHHNKPETLVYDENITVLKIIIANLYEHISNELHAYAQKLEDEG